MCSLKLALFAITSSCCRASDAGSIPTVGLGVAGNLAQDVDGTAAATEQWLRLGGRAIDTALMYHNDAGVRLGIARSQVQRADIFLTTKVPPEQMGFESTISAIDEARAGLGVDKIDCVLIHWPGRVWAKRVSDPPCVIDRGSAPADWTECRRQTWAALRSAKAQGAVRLIGVSNFEASHLKEMESTPDVMQAEFHPWWNRWDLLAWCAERKVQFVAYGSLGSAGATSTLQDVSLQRIASDSGVSAAQVLLKWAVSKGAAVIPSSRSATHMKQNLACCHGWSLSPDASTLLSSIPVKEQRRVIEPDPRFIFSATASPGDLLGPVPLTHTRLDLFGAADTMEMIGKSDDGGCWQGQFKPYPCCHPSFGALGLEGCWGGEYSFSRCCIASAAKLNLQRSSRVGLIYEKSFDYVVVGAGSGGSVVAAHLARQGFSVALLDSGSKDSPSLYTQHPNPSSPDQADRWFVNDIEWHLGAVKRRVQVISGRVLGGSSAVNGHIYTRTALPFSRDLMMRAYEDVERDLTRGVSMPDRAPLSTVERLMVHALGADDLSNTEDNFTSVPIGVVPVQRILGCSDISGRASSYLCAVARQEQVESELHVFPDSHVDKVILQDLRASGVVLAGDPQGRYIHAKREVILAAGALQTPLLLARTGIGHPADLERIGVHMMLENSHVGSNLQDHPYLYVQINTGIACDPESLAVSPLRELFFFYDHLPAARAKNRLHEWRLNVELKLAPKCLQVSRTPPSHSISYKAYLILLHSRTVGRVAPRSADPADPPIVLFDPFAGEGTDVRALIEYTRELYTMLRKAPKELGVTFDPPEAVIFDDFRAGRYCGYNLGLWQHPTGTARFGNVVDEQLRVFGVKGLRIADGSVLPDSAAGHPDAAIRALGRIAAHFASQ